MSSTSTEHTLAYQRRDADDRNRLFSHADTSTWIVLGATVAVVVAVKFILASDSPGPTLFGDELIYSHFSWQLRDLSYAPVPGLNFKATYITPLYPLVLVPATFAADWYQASLLTNAIVSSLVTVPVYFLAVRYVPRITALLIAMTAAIFPAQWIYSEMFMSENLFVVVFFLVLLAASEYFRQPTTWRLALFAVSVGVAFLTRPIALGIVPVGALVVAHVAMGGWFNPVRRSARAFATSVFNAARQALVFVGVFLLTIAPWVFVGMMKGDIAGVMGLRSSALRGDPPITNLWYWSLYYAAYFVLIGASHLFAAMMAVELRPPSQNARARLRPLVLTSVVGTLGLLIPTMRHSYRAYGTFGKLHGRYVTYLFVLFLLISLAFIANRRRAVDPSRRRLLATGAWGLGLSAFIASLCAIVLDNRDFMTYSNAPEGYTFVDVTGTWWVAGIACGGVLVVLMGFGVRGASSSRVAEWVAAFVLITTAAASLMLVRADPLSVANDRASHGRAIVDVARSTGEWSHVVVFDTEAGMTRKKVKRLEMELQFWRLPEGVRVLAFSEVGEDGLPRLPSGTLLATPRELPLDPVQRYEYTDTTWHVYQLE